MLTTAAWFCVLLAMLGFGSRDPQLLVAIGLGSLGSAFGLTLITTRAVLRTT